MLSKSFLTRSNRPGKAFVRPKILEYPSQSSKGLRGHLDVLKMTISSSKRALNKFLFLQGQVTHGYGRGSKKLGVPTANLPHYDKQLQENDIARGVYYGWAKVYGETAL